MKRGCLLCLCLLAVALGCTAREIVVNSTADSGEGTLRWALQTARSGDTITFNPKVFPPSAPTTIHLRNCLPSIWQGRITVDASEVGVIVDGQALPTDDAWGVEISSNGNAIYGLQVVNVPGPGIVLVEGASDNTIGGDRTLGKGPIGHANLCSGNNGGICMWGEGPSHNTITGNLIGTDVTGTTPFGNIDGIILSEGACYNTIGPGNVIAYNREHAIVVQGSDSFGNTITRNSIHDNGWGGIQLLDGGNGELASPLITSFDLSAGRIDGVAHPGCIIEFFSERFFWEERDEEEVRRLCSEGEILEGQAEVDSIGAFSFTKDELLTYTHITATATDREGNTSEFSMPTEGETRSWGIQASNRLPLRRVDRNLSAGLEYNRIGSMWGILDSDSPGVDLWLLENMHSLGLTWVKYYIDVPDWPEVGVFEGYSDGSVTPTQDAFVDGLIEMGGEVVLGLVFWDEAANARVSERGESYSRYETEEEIEAYLGHVQRIVSHFRGRIQYYEILNEQNVGMATQQHVEAEQYIGLIKRVIPIIRQIDPQAKIVVGTIPLDAELGQEQAAIEYLLTMTSSAIMPSVDVVSWHPFFGASPADPVSRDYYYAYPGIVEQIARTAADHGFTGEFMASEMSWWTPFSTPYFSQAGQVCSPTQAAKYYARALAQHLGSNIIAGVGGEGFDMTPPIVAVVKAFCTVMANHLAIDMPVEIDIETEGPVAYCAFRYPNGDRMLAIWTDGIAQDEDPGVPAIVTFRGLTAETVSGIDVLHGFEQELIFEIDGEDTVIQDLLVRDYPLLIRLSDVTMSEDYEETVGDGFHRLGEPGAGTGPDRDGDGVLDDEDLCPDWPGSPETSGC